MADFAAESFALARDTADPLAGSYYVESLTDEIEHLHGLLRQHGIEPNDGAA